MLSTKTLRQLAACSISIPTFAAPPAVAKETVYMPSAVAARLLGGNIGEATNGSGDARTPARETF